MARALARSQSDNLGPRPVSQLLEGLSRDLVADVTPGPGKLAAASSAATATSNIGPDTTLAS